MASRSCVSGCGLFLTSSDGHDRCPSCLGFRHAEAALVDESCSHCGNMTIAMLRSRYLLARRGGIPLALPRSSSSGRRTTSAQGQGDLRITVRASPSSASPRASHSSSTSHRLGFPDEYAGSSDGPLTLSWDPGLDMCPKFPPCPSGTRWWTCKRCPGRRQTQPLLCLAYQARRLPCPLGVRAHSTRGVASSWALARDICKAAGWATPNTFARFYNLRIEPVSSRVLVSDGQ